MESNGAVQTNIALSVTTTGFLVAFLTNNASGWAAAGQKGLTSGTTISYLLN
jgi:hypothetical protein